MEFVKIRRKKTLIKLSKCLRIPFGCEFIVSHSQKVLTSKVKVLEKVCSHRKQTNKYLINSEISQLTVISHPLSPCARESRFYPGCCCCFYGSQIARMCHRSSCSQHRILDSPASRLESRFQVLLLPPFPIPKPRWFRGTGLAPLNRTLSGRCV